MALLLGGGGRSGLGFRCCDCCDCVCTMGSTCMYNSVFMGIAVASTIAFPSSASCCWVSQNPLRCTCCMQRGIFVVLECSGILYGSGISYGTGDSGGSLGVGDGFMTECCTSCDKGLLSGSGGGPSVSVGGEDPVFKWTSSL